MKPVKILKVASMVAIVLISLVAIITGLNIFFFWSIFDWFQGTIHLVTGLDEKLTKAFAALIMALVVMLPSEKLIIAFTPIPQKNKGIYRASIFSAIAVFFLFLYFGGKNTYFDSQTRRALKYYSIAPSGDYRFFSAPGFDPETGDTLKAVTKEIILKSKGLYPVAKPRSDYRPPPNTIIAVPTRSTTTSTIEPVVNEPEKIVVYNPKTKEYPQMDLEANRLPKQKDPPYTHYLGDYQSPVRNSTPTVQFNDHGLQSAARENYANSNQKENWGRLIINNHFDSPVWIENASRNRVLTVSAGQSIDTKLPPGRYYFMQNNNELYKTFTITPTSSHTFNKVATPNRNSSVNNGYRPVYYGERQSSRTNKRNNSYSPYYK